MSQANPRRHLVVAAIMRNNDGSKFGFATDLETGGSVFIPNGVVRTEDMTEDDVGQRFYGFVVGSTSENRADRLAAFLKWEDEEDSSVEDLDMVEDRPGHPMAALNALKTHQPAPSADEIRGQIEEQLRVEIRAEIEAELGAGHHAQIRQLIIDIERARETIVVSNQRLMHILTELKDHLAD